MSKNHVPSPLASCLILCLVAVAPVAAADDADDAKRSSAEEYVEVNVSEIPESNTITTKLHVPLDRTPANVGVVGKTLIGEQDAVVLGDALRNVSSLHIQSGSGVQDYFVIRGFDSISSALVMTDGAQEPEATFYPMYNIEGIEVLKGPGGFLYGSNPLAGAVNLVRKQPLGTDFVQFGASYGSFATGEATIDWNAAFGEDRDVAVRLNGLFFDTDGYRDGIEGEQRALNPSFTWHIDDRSSLTINLEYVEADFTPDSGIPVVDGAVADIDRKRSFQEASDYSEQDISRFQVDWQRQMSDRVMLRNKTYYRELDWQTDGTIIFGTQTVDGMGMPLADPLVIRNLGRLDDLQQFVGNQFEAVMTFDGGAVSHRLLAGLEVASLSDEYTFGIDVLPARTLFTGFDVPLGGTSPPPAVGDVDSTVIAPYVVDQMGFGDAFELLVGLRYDDIDVDGTITTLFNPVPADFSRDDSELSPMLGAVWRLGDSLNLYANAGRSYSPPSTRLVDELDPSSREPERATQLEIGAKKRFSDRVRATFAVYQLDRDNIAIADQNFFTQQSGDQRSRGFEVEVACELPASFVAVASYAYTDTELVEFMPFVTDPFTMTGGYVDYSGNEAALAPDHIANFWLSKRFGSLGVAGGARWFSDYYVSEDNQFEVDGALVLDAAVFYDFKRLRLQLNLKNLTDTEYERRGVGGSASVIPADPFAVFASVSYRM